MNIKDERDYLPHIVWGSMAIFIILCGLIWGLVRIDQEQENLDRARIHNKHRQEAVCNRALGYDKTWKDSLMTAKIINCPEVVDGLTVNSGLNF